MFARYETGTEISLSVMIGHDDVTELGAWAGHTAQQAILALSKSVRALPYLLFGQVLLGLTHTE